MIWASTSLTADGTADEHTYVIVFRRQILIYKNVLTHWLSINLPLPSLLGGLSHLYWYVCWRFATLYIAFPLFDICVSMQSIFNLNLTQFGQANTILKSPSQRVLRRQKYIYYLCSASLFWMSWASFQNEVVCTYTGPIRAYNYKCENHLVNNCASLIKLHCMHAAS